MAKQVKQYIKNPKYGQPGEPERILVPQTISENGAFLNRMAQIEKLEYNATQVTGNNYNGLAEALASVTNDKYKVKGIVLTWFDSAENQWKSMRYNGADSTGWDEVGNWVEAGGAGGSGNTNYYQIPAVVTELTSSSTSEEIQAAFGGDSGFLSVVKAVEEGAFLYLGVNQNPYIYVTIPYCMWHKAEVETDGILGFPYDTPGEGSRVIAVQKRGSCYEIDITESSSSGGASEHTLDLSPLFDEEGRPVATVTDEFLAEVKKAYEEKYSNALYNGAISPMYISFDAESQYYLISFDIDTGESGSYSKYKFTSRIHVSDKSSEPSVSILNIKQDGRGNRCLTDNGGYAEFASPVKVKNGGSGTVTQELSPNTLYEFGECTSLTITLASEISGIRNEYMFEFVSGATPTMLSIPETVGWMGGKAPTIEANKTYQCSIVNNIAVIGGK